MPKARVTNSFFDIQIQVRSQDRLTIVQMVRGLIELLPRLLKALIKEYQKSWLETDLGPYGTVGNLFGNEGIECPECQARDANRKSWRDRRWVVPVLGEIECPLRWVECQDCSRSWTPYKETLGIKDDVQYSPDVMVDHLKEAVQTTYKKASDLREHSPGAMTIWRKLLEWVPEVSRDGPIDRTVLVDATKIPRHKEDGQWVLTLAEGLSLNQKATGWNRQYLAGTIGKEVDIKSKLGSYEIQRLMHDGSLDVSQLCEIEGRCSWHLPYTVRQLLHQDDIHGEDNKRRWRWLQAIIWNDEASIEDWDARLETWVQANEDEAPKAASHVRHAKEGLRNVRTQHDEFGMKTNSLMEREMVEINKRFENGGGWTKRGSSAMLAHYQLLRHEPEKWKQKVMINGGHQMPENQQNSQV